MKLFVEIIFSNSVTMYVHVVLNGTKTGVSNTPPPTSKINRYNINQCLKKYQHSQFQSKFCRNRVIFKVKMNKWAVFVSKMWPIKSIQKNLRTPTLFSLKCGPLMHSSQRSLPKNDDLGRKVPLLKKSFIMSQGKQHGNNVQYSDGTPIN